MKSAGRTQDPLPEPFWKRSRGGTLEIVGMSFLDHDAVVVFVDIWLDCHKVIIQTSFCRLVEMQWRILRMGS